MPKKFFKKRRYRKSQKKRFKPRKSGKLNYVYRKVKQLDSADNKFTSSSANLYNLPTMIGLTSTTTLTGQAQGLHRDFTSQINLNAGSNSDRLTNKVKLKYLSMRIHMRSAPVSSVSALVTRNCYKVRLMVVYQKIVGDNQSNSGDNITYPKLGQILYVNPNCTSSDLLAHQTWVNRKNFKILYDKVHILDPCYLTYVEGGTQIPKGQAKTYAYDHIKLNLSKLPEVTYNNDGINAATTTASGRLMFFAWSDNIVSNVAPIDMDYDYVLNYD